MKFFFEPFLSAKYPAYYSFPSNKLSMNNRFPSDCGVQRYALFHPMQIFTNLYFMQNPKSLEHNPIIFGEGASSSLLKGKRPRKLPSPAILPTC